MKRFIKQSIAVTSALAMTLSIAPAAFAATDTTGSYDGDSKLEGYVNKNVYDITVPTVAEGGIDFTIDPQGLLNVANKTKWADGAGAVYFKNTGDKYSAKSDDIKLINNSSFEIKVNCAVSVDTKGSDVALVEATALTTASKPSLYLGLISNDGTEKKAAVTKEGAKSEDIALAKVDEKTESKPGYEIKASEEAVEGVDKSPNGYYYTYSLSDDYVAATNGKAVTFALEGKCDTSADWSNIKTDVMKAQIVWTVTADELKTVAPQTTTITTSTYSRASSTNAFNITWGQDVPEASRSILKIEGANTSDMDSAVQFATDSYSLSGTTLTLNGTKAPFGPAAVGNHRYVKVTFANNVSLVIELTVEA